MLCSVCATNLPEGSQFCLKCGQPVSDPADNTDPPVAEVHLACSRCGADLPEGAQFCLKCGKPVSVSSKASANASPAVTLEAPPPPVPRPHRTRRVILLLLAGVLLALAAYVVTSDSSFAQGMQELLGWKHDQSILATPFSVSPHSFRYYKFSLPEGSLNVAIVGQFSASSDSRNVGRKDKDTNKDKDADNNIEVYVLSEPAFTVWQNGYATSSVFESGRVSQGTVQAELPAGAGIYYLVFSNKFAPKSAKSINATVALRYKSWLPEWFRRMKGRLWNWLGL
ncbi:MAG TPA: zinc ribbon domain-containing protein [Candidatus Sulfotelmatobacter sp.]|nr:zinc ribbon domain-containing protein [Candidatus Sulfotelmatobacter sp.]